MTSIMDNSDDILKQFGGAITNNLNCVLQLNDDPEEGAFTFPYSPYIDLNLEAHFEMLKNRLLIC